jgi:uncharacterized repeat protein (TIGR02543 family)
MKNRRILLRVLLPVSLVLGMVVVPAAAAGASGPGPLPEARSASYSTADNTSPVSAMTLSTPHGNGMPMVAAGKAHTVGLKADGTVLAVGNNDYLQCRVDDWTDIVQIAAGGYHTVGLKTDGTVIDTDYNVSGWTDIIQVAAGDAQESTSPVSATVGLRSDGTVVAVGDNSYGQCDVGGWIDITQLAAGIHHTVGLRSDGTVIAIGSNMYGQCNVTDWTDIIQVVAGGAHTVGLKSDGTVIAVGSNSYGQCDVGDWTDIVQVAAGRLHTVGLKRDGTVVAVGWSYPLEGDIGDWTGITQVAAGRAHTVGLKSDGTVVAVGDNGDGQCNVGNWNLLLEVLTIHSTDGGTVTVPGEGIFSYDKGTMVDLVAEPDENYEFVEWAGGTETIADVNAAETNITMEDYYSVTANFGLEEGLCSLTISSTAGGNVTTPGEGILIYDEGTVVGLVAEPEEGYQFVSWTGDVSTVGNISAASTSISTNDDYSITANFEEIPPIVLTIHSSAGGTVTTPGQGSFDYDDGTVVNLVAEPRWGYRFVNWTGNVSTVGNTSATSTNITLHDDYSITANFTADFGGIPLRDWALIGVLIALVIAALVVFFVRKRRLARMGLENKIWGFLRRPATTFREVKEETLGGALKYALIGLLFFGVLMGIMLALLTSGGLFDLVRDWLPGFGWIPDNPLLLIAEVVGFSVAGGMLLIFIGGAWMHIWVHIFGGRRGHTYKQTIKALVYGATPMYVIGWLPFVGGVIGSIWAIVLIIVALRELHGISTGRATGAALLAIGIAGAVVMLLAVVLLAAFLGPFVYLFIWWLALFLLMGG